MKKTLSLLILAALCAFAITVSGCQASTTETMSVSERMNAFIDDINAENWSELKDHTSKTSTMYSLADDDFWETYFFADSPWEVTATGTTSVATGEGGTAYTFTLVESDTDYFVIETISYGTTEIFY